MVISPYGFHMARKYMHDLFGGQMKKPGNSYERVLDGYVGPKFVRTYININIYIYIRIHRIINNVNI